jgi:hypothetical protein
MPQWHNLQQFPDSTIAESMPHFRKCYIEFTEMTRWVGEDRRSMQFVKYIRNQEHTRRYSIAATDAGWEVREERDSEVVKQVRYFDWHRVERARHSIVV